ncbi:MAG TPA: hypothetical protein VGX22_00305 [Candidatus Dormibacteraeota bacterium]|nr:hypothetical protein [Candidatus Dormibacteraeota bacterium]
MRAFSYVSLGVLGLGLFLTACEGNGEVISGGGTIPPNATGGAASNAPDAMLRAPGPMTPDRASGGGAGTRP